MLFGIGEEIPYRITGLLCAILAFNCTALLYKCHGSRMFVLTKALELFVCLQRRYE